MRKINHAFFVLRVNLKTKQTPIPNVNHVFQIRLQVTMDQKHVILVLRRCCQQTMRQNAKTVPMQRAAKVVILEIIFVTREAI